ncbi:MAG: uracil-DNA glycosylase [Chloroflexi bacterium]|nr:MAG: uracil-DNA glycosylase [Chloroflexota bacterium]MBL1195298.1 uracil-DNA glycosylase [Chloroflexota bacterium]NOH12582.1 uracil-DNA glycosylase family protein [Chloroflexota bacterium]
MSDQNNFAELQTRMRACRLCVEGGYQVTPPAVTQGQVTARMMTIGQAPGITEVEAKRPFNAGSGTRLFAWLREAGIDEDWFRSTQYMSSVTKCYPGRSKSGGGDRVPSRAEQKLCRPFLEEEIALVNPELIILIGGLAIKLFFPAKAKLTEIIGTQMQTVEGRWIVPVPHPSGASRWHQIKENQALIQKAIGLIRGHKERMFGEEGN